MSESNDYYQVLGINRNANSDEIRKAYLYKANILHPDRLSAFSESVRRKAEEELKKVNQAYDILKDPQKRREYDHRNIHSNDISYSNPIYEEPVSQRSENQNDYVMEKTDTWDNKVARIFKYPFIGALIAIILCFATGMFFWGKPILVQVIVALGFTIGFTFAVL